MMQMITFFTLLQVPKCSQWCKWLLPFESLMPFQWWFWSCILQFLSLIPTHTLLLHFLVLSDSFFASCLFSEVSLWCVYSNKANNMLEFSFSCFCWPKHVSWEDSGVHHFIYVFYFERPNLIRGSICLTTMLSEPVVFFIFWFFFFFFFFLLK